MASAGTTLPHLIWDFQPPELGEQSFCHLSHPVCGNLLGQIPSSLTQEMIWKCLSQTVGTLEEGCPVHPFMSTTTSYLKAQSWAVRGFLQMPILSLLEATQWSICFNSSLFSSGFFPSAFVSLRAPCFFLANRLPVMMTGSLCFGLSSWYPLSGGLAVTR